MSEEVAAPVAPAETPEVSASPAEGGAPAPAQNIADQAPAAEKPDGETPAEKQDDDTDELPGKRTRRLERRLNRLHKERAEALARGEHFERLYNETRQQQQQPAQDPGAPKLADFEYDEAKYREAVEKYASTKAAREAEAKRTQDAQKQYVQKVTSEWSKKVAAVGEKYADFADVTGDVQLATPALYAMMEADNGPDIAYYLGNHDDEAEQIASLSIPAQIRAIGRLEAKLAAEPAKPKTPSKAPAPITPVSGGGGASDGMPSDKDDIATWMRKENERVRKLSSA